MHKLLWDFEIQTDHLLSARRPILIIINKKERTDHRVKLNESEKKNKYFDLARELKKLWNMKVTIIPIAVGVLGSHQKINKRTGGLGNKRTGGDHPNFCIIEIG